MKFVKVNADANPQTCQAHRVRGLPTVAFFSDGRRVGELVGLQPRPAIAREIEALLAGG